MPRPHLTAGKDLVPIVQEAGWASGPVWTGAENLAPPGFDPWTVQPVDSRYIDRATRPTERIYYYVKCCYNENSNILNLHSDIQWSIKYVHNTCARCPFVPDMPRRAQCGTLNFLRDTVGVHRIVCSFHYLFMYLFVFEV